MSTSTTTISSTRTRVSFKINPMPPRPRLTNALVIFCEAVIERQRIEKETADFEKQEELFAKEEADNWADDDLSDAIDEAYYEAEKWSDF